MYVASFHLRLFYRLSRHGLDSDPVQVLLLCITIEVSAGSYTRGMLMVTRQLRHRNLGSDRKRRGDRRRLTSMPSCDLLFCS
jgi:hypothetical protein